MILRRITPTTEWGGTRLTRSDDDLGATAEWYLTIRCANLMCARLIAFQKSVHQGDNPDLRIAITGSRVSFVHIARSRLVSAKIKSSGVRLC